MQVDIKAELAKFRAEIPRPPRDKRGRAWNGATQEQVNRHQGIKRQILRGKTFEAAKAYYDAPKGVCYTCGELAHTKTGKQCKACHREVARKVQARARQRTGGGYDRHVNCAVCGAPFVAKNGGRKNCDAHLRRQIGVIRERKKKERTPALPPTWEKKSEKPVEIPPPPRPVDVRGHTVTRVPSFGRPGLRNLFGDDQGRTWSAAD